MAPARKGEAGRGAARGGTARIGLRCSTCETRLDAALPANTCPSCGRPILHDYDLARAARTMTLEALRARPADLARWEELLPLDDPAGRIDLGERETPLVPLPRLGQALGVPRLWMKDESQLPTGTFKARGMAMALSRLRELGVRRVAVPSAGNAAAAMAAYAARGGMEAWIAVPEGTPAVNLLEARALGARVEVMGGDIGESGTLLRERAAAGGFYDLSTLREPYRLEGKKTLGLEIALAWGAAGGGALEDLPDAIVYPTGGGTGLLGMFVAFEQLRGMGLLRARNPRFFAVQPEGCAALARAFETGAERSEPWPDARTCAPGLRVPHAFADTLLLRVVRETSGAAVAVPETGIARAARRLAREEGVFTSPEAAAAFAALDGLLGSGRITAEDRVLVVQTAAGLKYGEPWRAFLREDDGGAAMRGGAG